MVKYAERYSPSYNSPSSPWKTEFDKMAMKTVLRQLLSKWGPTSTEMQKVEQLDDKAPTPIQAPNQSVIDIDADTGEVISMQEETTQPQESQQPARAPFMDDLVDE